MASFLRHGTLALALVWPVFASPLLEGRGTSNRNNLLRCLDPTGTKPTDLASQSAATAFCSSFLSIPVVTSTIATTTPVIQATTSLTTTDATAVVTSVATSTVLVVESSTTTTTTSPGAATADKRTPVPVVDPPACVTKGTYASDALSSACSCINVTPSTTYVTATASPSTNVVVSVIHETTTSTFATTTLTSSTTTETTTAVATAAPPPTCPGDTITSNGKLFCVLHRTAISAGWPNWESLGYNFPNLEACVDLCATTYAPRCIGADFVVQGGECQMIYVSGGTQPLDGWEAAYLAQ